MSFGNTERMAARVIMQRHPQWKYQLHRAEPVGPLGTLAACGWPWVARGRCLNAIIGRRNLRQDCGNTFTKLCCGMWKEYEDAWLRGEVDPEGDIAKQLKLRPITCRQHSYANVVLLAFLVVLVLVVWKTAT